MRADLALSYIEVGVLLALPRVFGHLVEPALAVLGDTWRRRHIMRGSAIVFAAALAGIVLGVGFFPILIALMLWSPASGGLVGLSQATLADHEADARELNMARWALAGSAGMLAGPALLAAVIALGFGWRAAFGVTVVAAVVALLAVWRADGGSGEPHRAGAATPRAAPAGIDASAARAVPAPVDSLRAALVTGARGAADALRRRAVIRWLALLELADLALDGLYGFLALYVVDVMGLTGAQAGLVVTGWTAIGLLGDAAVIRVLRVVGGLTWLRASAAAVLVLLPAFLLAGDPVLKFVLVSAVGLCTSGWYAVLQARLYAELPGRSATTLALTNVSGLAGTVLPFALALAAERFGLAASMWLILAAPLALLFGLPRGARGIRLVRHRTALLEGE